MKVAVTGAFGYSGKYITRRLLAAQHQVITLTNSTHRENPFGSSVQAFPFHFDEPIALEKSLKGVDVLINTYWVRFNHRHFNHQEAVANTKTLFETAKAAGVRRVVHISVTNPDIRSDLPYFRGKAELELALQASGVGYSILRPTVLFGKEDILINNIAWALRHLPIFGVFGKGDYQLQPIYVDDLAAAVVEQSTSNGNRVLEAIGPETSSYRDLAQMIKRVLGLRTPIVGLPPIVGYWAGRIMGFLLKDVVITREEIRGLMENRLYVDAPPLGGTRLSEWVKQHRETLGRNYASELARRTGCHSAYRAYG
jgi:uncharacterized protein YbjT (DUF2867 family)